MAANKTTSSKVKGTIPEEDNALSRAFEFGDEDSGLSFEPQDQDSRTPVGSVVSGALEGFYSTVTDQDFITDRVKDAFPDSFNETLKSLDVVSRSVGQLYDDSVKELKPQLSGIARKIDRLVPENQKFLKSITSKFSEWTGGNTQSFRAPSKEEAEERTIQTALADLFKAQAGVQTDLAARDSAERQIDRNIEKRQFGASMDVSTSSYNMLSRLAGYTEGPNQAFQKKSIELQLRQLFATRELLRLTKDASEASFKQREAVIKNTGLPDFVKIHSLEMVKEQTIRKLINGAQQAMFGDQDPLTAALSRFVNEGKKAFQGFKTGLLDPAKDAADMLASQFEEGGMMGSSKNDNLSATGNMIGSSTGQAAGVWARDKIKGFREKIPGYDILEKFGTMAKTDLANPAVLKERFFESQEVKDFIEKRGLDDDSMTMKMFNGFFDILTQKFTPQTQLQSGKTGIDLLEANDSGFSRRSDQTLNVVLPGYLSRILREVASIRTGQPVDLTIFDHNSGSFKFSSVMAADIKKTLVGKFAASSTKRDVNDAYESLFKDANLSDEDKVKAKKFILGISRENIGYTSKGMQESETFERLNTADQEKFREIIERRLGKDNDPDNKTYNEVSTRISSARKSQPNVYQYIQTELSLGRGDELEAAGLIRKSPRGGYEINIEEVLEMMDKEALSDTGIGDSDINLKRGIKKFNPRDAIRNIRNIAISKWKYRKDRYGKGSSKQEIIGPMAQDVRAHMGDEAAPDGNKIDLITMNGNNMAAIQDLDQRLLGYEKKQEALRLSYDKSNEPMRLGYREPPRIISLGYNPSVSGPTSEPIEEVPQDKPLSKFEQLVSDIKKDTAEMVEHLSKVATFGFFNFSELADFDFEKHKDKLKGFLENKRTEAMSASEHMLAGIKKFGKNTGDKFKRPYNYLKGKLQGLKDIPGKAYQWGKKKVMDNYGRVTDLAKRGVKSVWDAGADAVRFGVQAAPKVYRTSIDTSKAVGMFLKKRFDMKITDVYVAGEKEPRLRANLMRNGFYFDQATGKVILDWTDVKGTIVDEKKNIILSAEEIAKGIFDADGKPLELSMTKAIKGAWNLGKTLVKDAKNAVVATAKGIGKIASLIGEKAKGINFSRFGVPSFEGMTLVSKKTHNVLVQIRDMMAKRFGYQLPPDEEDTTSESKLDKATKTLSKWKEKIKEKVDPKDKSKTDSRWSRLKDTIKGFFSKNKADTGYFDQFKDRATNAKESLKDKAKGFFNRFRRKPKTTQADPGPTLSASRELGDPEFTPVTRIYDEPEVKYTGRIGRETAKLEGMKRKGLKALAMDKLRLGYSPIKQEFPIGPARKPNFTSYQQQIEGSSGNKVLAIGTDKKSNLDYEDVEYRDKPNEEKPKGLFDRLKDKAKKAASKIPGVKKLMPEKKDSDTEEKKERKGGAFERYRQMQEEIKNRVIKKSGVSTELRYQDTANSFLSKAMGMISGVTEWFKDKLGGLFGTIGSMALGGLGKGLLGAAGVIGKGVTTAGGALFKGASALYRGQATSLAARGILGTVARTAATAALASGSPLLAMGSMALSGAMAVVSSPVVLGAAAVALAGYGAYKSYKYLTRNNIDKWQKIRVKQYGLTDSSRDASHYHKLMELEALVIKTGLQFRNNQASIGTTFNFDDVVAIFGVDKTDKDKLASLLKWFNGRFKPFFLTHMTSLYGLNKKYRLSAIEDMTHEDKIKYLDVMAFPDGPYGVTDSPFSDIEELDTDQSDVLTAIENIKKDLREKKADTKFKEVPKPSVDKTQPNQAKSAAVDPTLAKPDNASSAVRNAMRNGSGATAGEDGAKPVNTTPTGDDKAGAATGFKVAAGPISDGKGGMQFIKVGRDTSIDKLNPAFLKSLGGMAEEYNQATGKTLNVNEGFRTYEQQAALYAKYPHKAAPPGSSLHEKGLAVDIDSAQLNELDKLGLMRKYGITRPVGGETWHAEPIGIQLNINRARQDPSFAQQAIEAGLLKGGKGAGTNPRVAFGKRSIEDVHAALYGTDSKVNNKPLDGPEVTMASKAMGTANQAIAKASESSKAQVASTPPTSPTQTMARSTQNQPASAASTSEDAGKLMKTDIAAANKNIDALKGMGAINPQSKEDVMRAIDKAAQMTSTDTSTLKTFAALESGFKPNAAAKTSSAKGLFQFLDGTWKEMLSKHGAKYGLDASAKQTDPMASSLMAGEYIKTNMNTVSRVKPDVNIVDAYLTHFLGPEGAKKMLAANPSELASKVNPKAASANYNMFATNGRLLTVGEFYDKIRTKIVNKAQEYGISLPNNIFSSNPAGQGTQSRPASFVAPLANPVTAKQESRPASDPQPRLVAKIATPVTPFGPSATQSGTSNVTKPADTYAKLEDIGQKQLTELQTLVKLFTSVDSKLDMEKLAQLLGKMKDQQPGKPDVSPAPKTRPGQTMVDDRRYEPSVNIRRT